MSVKTTYTCDKCKKEVDKESDLWELGIEARNKGSSSFSSFKITIKDFVRGQSIEVCKPCLESFGLYVTEKTPEKEKALELSVEQRIRLILEDIGVVFD